jgi:heptosyltransferase-2
LARLLLIKLGAIGDCIMLIPAAYAMHEAGYEVEWVCSHDVAPVLRLYPWLTVHAVNGGALLGGSLSGRLRAIASVWRLLAGRRYDLCATLYYDRRYRLLTLPVRAGRRIMLSHDDRAYRLLEGRHHTDEFARILLSRPDGETPARMSPVLPPVLPLSPLPSATEACRIVLFPGGARNVLRTDNLRRWPAESYAALCAALLDQGWEVVLAGGPNDRWASEAFTSHPHLHDRIGLDSLTETIGLLTSAHAVVTHDSGPLHIAGLTHVPIVTLFGPTDPHARVPARANTVALWGGEAFACRPCYDGRSPANTTAVSAS